VDDDVKKKWKLLCNVVEQHNLQSLVLGQLRDTFNAAMRSALSQAANLVETSWNDPNRAETLTRVEQLLELYRVLELG